MLIKDKTKGLFADSLVRLTEQVAFKKITVKMIADTCQSRRQTFYYHFHDKHDLVAWIYIRDVEAILLSNENGSWDYVLECMFINMYEKRDFYRKVFADDGQNSIMEYLLKRDFDFYLHYLALSKNAVDEALKFAIRYHTYACTYLTRQWLLSKSAITPEVHCQRMLDCMPRSLYELMSDKQLRLSDAVSITELSIETHPAREHNMAEKRR